MPLGWFLLISLSYRSTYNLASTGKWNYIPEKKESKRKEAISPQDRVHRSKAWLAHFGQVIWNGNSAHEPWLMLELLLVQFALVHVYKASSLSNLQGKDSLLKKWCWGNGMPSCKRKKLGLSPMLCEK
jgi:hypothetical protein